MEFLNDSLIDYQLKIIQERLQAKDRALLDKCHFFNSFFYKRLHQLMGGNKVRANPEAMAMGYRSVRRWTKGVDLFKKDFIFVPINEALHWSLAVIYRPGASSPPINPPLHSMRRPFRLPPKADALSPLFHCTGAFVEQILPDHGSSGPEDPGVSAGEAVAPLEGSPPDELSEPHVALAVGGDVKEMDERLSDGDPDSDDVEDADEVSGEGEADDAPAEVAPRADAESDDGSVDRMEFDDDDDDEPVVDVEVEAGAEEEDEAVENLPEAVSLHDDEDAEGTSALSAVEPSSSEGAAPPPPEVRVGWEARRPCVMYLDSLGGTKDKALRLLQTYLSLELQDKDPSIQQKLGACGGGKSAAAAAHSARIGTRAAAASVAGTPLDSRRDGSSASVEVVGERPACEPDRATDQGDTGHDGTADGRAASEIDSGPNTQIFEQLPKLTIAVPLQNNSYDCGLYMLRFIEMIAERQPDLASAKRKRFSDAVRPVLPCVTHATHASSVCKCLRGSPSAFTIISFCECWSPDSCCCMCTRSTTERATC